MLGRKRQRRRKSASPHGSFAKQIFIGLFLLLLLFLVGSAIWYGSRLESLTVTQVKIQGGETVDHNAVLDVVEEELKGEHYKLIPRRFVWALPEADIISKTKLISRVKDVWLERPEDNILVANFTEYHPQALWCPSLEDSSTCAFIDESGYAFTMAPPLIGSSFLRYFNSREVKVGEQPFSAGFIKDTSFLASEMRQQFNFSIVQIEKVGPEEVIYYLSGGNIIKTTLRQPADTTLNNLSVILFSKDFRHLSSDNFTYIDLRFGDKVFVNEEIIEEEIVEETVATTTPIE